MIPGLSMRSIDEYQAMCFRQEDDKVDRLD